MNSVLITVSVDILVLFFHTIVISLLFRLFSRNLTIIFSKTLNENFFYAVIILYSTVYVLTSFSLFYFYFDNIDVFKENDDLFFKYFLKFLNYTVDIKLEFIFFFCLIAGGFLVRILVFICIKIVSGGKNCKLINVIYFSSFLIKYCAIFIVKSFISVFAICVPLAIIVSNNETGLWCDDANYHLVRHIGFYHIITDNIFMLATSLFFLYICEKIPVYDFKNLISENKKENLLMILQPVASYFGFTLSTDHNPASAADVLPKAPQPDGSSAQDRQK